MLTRGLHSLLAIIVVVAFMMVGLQTMEGLLYLNAFYFTAMLATGEGPNTAPTAALGNVFVGLMAFIFIGTVVTALLFIFGPFFAVVAKEGLEKVEEVERDLGKKKEERV
jgi:predicted membrane protein